MISTSVETVFQGLSSTRMSTVRIYLTGMRSRINVYRERACQYITTSSTMRPTPAWMIYSNSRLPCRSSLGGRALQLVFLLLLDTLISFANVPSIIYTRSTIPGGQTWSTSWRTTGKARTMSAQSYRTRCTTSDMLFTTSAALHYEMIGLKPASFESAIKNHTPFSNPCMSKSGGKASLSEPKSKIPGTSN
jgi:hypothetical protein